MCPKYVGSSDTGISLQQPMAIATAFVILEASWKKKKVLNMKSDAVWPPGNPGLLGMFPAHGV